MPVDTLLAMLQDVTHAAGNISVIVTGEVKSSVSVVNLSNANIQNIQNTQTHITLPTSPARNKGL
jgi:hypothetical protein